MHDQGMHESVLKAKPDALALDQSGRNRLVRVRSRSVSGRWIWSPRLHRFLQIPPFCTLWSVSLPIFWCRCDVVIHRDKSCLSRDLGGAIMCVRPSLLLFDADYHVPLSFLSSHSLTFVRLVPVIDTIVHTRLRAITSVPVLRCFFPCPFPFVDLESVC